VPFTLCVTDLPEHISTERLSVSSCGEEGNGSSINPSISADGHYVAYSSNASDLLSGDTNAVADIFVAHIDDFFV
jgi:hypothetical protein